VPRQDHIALVGAAGAVVEVRRVIGEGVVGVVPMHEL
jgi:hypothetical protein